ncbi:MAG: hypothetical protein WCR07_12945 [Verrucomicrobiota bacterium]
MATALLMATAAGRSHDRMNASEQKKLLKEFYNAIPLQVPSPSRADIQPMAYVEGIHLTDGRDPLGELRRAIEFRDTAASYLFSGQRGSGKTTELIHLTRSLRDDGHAAYYVDALDYLKETAALGITDLLVAVLGAFSEAYARGLGSDPARSGYWERIKDFLTRTEVQPSEATLKLGDFADLKLALKDNPTFKESLRKISEASLDTFVKGAREFVDGIVQDVRDRGLHPDAKVVLIVDSLEKVRGSGSDADAVFQSLSNVFFGHAHNLGFNTLHVVYCVPPTLPLVAPGIQALYGGIHGLPHIKVEETPRPQPAEAPDANPLRQGARHEPGINLMLSVLDAHFPRWAEVFPPSQLREVAHASGGNLRIFFLIIQRALLKCPGRPLPMTDDSIVQYALRDTRADFQLSKEDRDWLMQVAKSKGPALDGISGLATLARLFDNHLILDYRNGKAWCDVLPLVRELIHPG